MKRSYVIALVVGLLGLAGGGYLLWKIYGSTPSVDRAVELAPADAIAYANVFVNPSNDQKRALRDLIEKFPQFDDTEDATGRLFEQLDVLLEPAGLTFDEDIKPVLGRQVALFISPDVDSDGEPEVGIAVGLKDVDKAEATVDRGIEKSGAEVSAADGYRVLFGDEEDPFAFATVNEFLVGGTEPAVQHMVASPDEGDSLADSDRFADAFAELPEDRVASFWVDGDALVEESKAAGALPPDQEHILSMVPGIGSGTFAATVTLDADHVDFEMSTSIPEVLADVLGAFADSPDPLEGLPKESSVAVSVPDAGAVTKEVLDLARAEGADVEEFEAGLKSGIGLGLEDVVPWLGNTRAFFRGTGPLDVGLAAIGESRDPDATHAAVDAASQALSAFGIGVQPEEASGLEGFRAQLGLPLSVLGGDRLIVGLGGLAIQGALSPDETLADSEGFRRVADALGDRYEPNLYANVPAMVKLVETTQPQDLGPEFQEIRPYLIHLTDWVMGVALEDERLFAKLVVGVE